MSAATTERRVVHVVDDDESLRTAVSRVLRVAGYEVRGYASAGEFALARSEELSGCLLLDVRMPGPSGFDLQDSLGRGGQALPIIFLTGHGDIPMSVRAMKAGAVDFLTKPVQRADLLAAVESAMAREAEQRDAQSVLKGWHARLASLTIRERDVFDRVTVGQPNKQIAVETGTAERTVKAHRARMMEKMNAGSLAELVHIAELIKSGGEPTAPGKAKSAGRSLYAEGPEPNQPSSVGLFDLGVCLNIAPRGSASRP